MIGKRLILVFSILLTALLYLGLYRLAPQITLFERNQHLASVAPQFRIHIRPDLAQPPAPPPEETADLLSRPGSMADLFQRSEERLTPGLSPAAEPAPVPRIAERLASEAIDRAYDLDQDPDFMQKVDARIIEIAEHTARKEIEVARRLVRPSDTRLLQEEEFPALRGAEEAREERLSFEANVRSTLMEPVTPGGVAGASGEKADADASVEEAPPVTVEAPPLPQALEGLTPVEAQLEQLALNQQPIAQEAERLKAESPYLFLDDLVDIHLDAYLPPEESQGYFRVRITPRKDTEVEVLPKQVTFVIDASNSIQQHKLDLTARGVRKALANLRPEDHFNIVAFRDSSTRFRPDMIPATPEALAAAEAFLDTLESRGETDVYQAILPVLEAPPAPGQPGLVVVMSDGRPTTGLRDGRMIINSLTADNRLKHSIYAFGGGNTVNRYLLELLAYRNKGRAEVAGDLEAIDEAFPDFFEQMRDPLLVNLEADYGRISEENVFPRVLPDFYRDQPIEIYGRFHPDQDGAFVMRLSGEAGAREKELIFRADLQEALKGDFSIARNWAFQKVYHLIGEISQEGETPERIQALRALCAKYNIRTTYDQ